MEQQISTSQIYSFMHNLFTVFHKQNFHLTDYITCRLLNFNLTSFMHRLCKKECKCNKLVFFKSFSLCLNYPKIRIMINQEKNKLNIKKKSSHTRILKAASIKTSNILECGKSVL